MAHCSFSFLMELYKAWGGGGKQIRGLWVSTPVSELRAFPSHLGDEPELRAKGSRI